MSSRAYYVIQSAAKDLLRASGSECVVPAGKSGRHPHIAALVRDPSLSLRMTCPGPELPPQGPPWWRPTRIFLLGLMASIPLGLMASIPFKQGG